MTAERSTEVTNRAELERLRLATRLSGVYTWSFELGDGVPASATGMFTHLWPSLGYHEGEVPSELGDRLALIIVPEDRARVLAEAQAYLEGSGEGFESEFRVRHKDGSVRWNLARGGAVRDAGGRPLRFSGTGVDVTRLKQAEEGGRAANEALDLAAQISGFAVTDLDLRGGAAQLAEKVRGVMPEDMPHVTEAFHALVSGRSPELHVEYRARNPHDEDFRWRLERGKCFYDDGGAPVRYVGVSHDIQQLKAAEDEAQRAVQHLRLATDLSGVGVWGYEVGNAGDLAEAKSTFANDGVLASLGYDPGEVSPNLAAAMGAVVHREDLPRMGELLQDCFGGKTPVFDAECRFIAKDGSLHWKLVRGIVTRDAAGRPLTFMGTAVDVTQLKQAQEELQRVKERLELAVTGSKACTWDFELKDGQLAGSTPVFTNAWELCGFEVPQDPKLVGEAFAVLIAPEDLGPFVGKIQAFLDGKEREWESELRIVHKDGSDRWHLTRGVAERDGTGTARRFTGASIDITDRKLTERALKESEERFRHTFENAAVGMILTDLEGRFLEYNARFCEFLGYTRAELAERRFVEFMVPDEVENDLERQRRVVRGEMAWFSRDKRYLRKDGAIVWGNITVSVIQRHADGTPAHVLGILQDINERKDLESKIEKAQARMELALRGSDVAVFDGEIPGGDAAASTWTHFNMWEPMGIDPASAPTDFEGVVALTVYPDDLPAALEKFGAVAQAHASDLYLEHRVAHRDGSVRWRLTRGTFLYDGAGTLSRFIGTSSDITKLKQIEGELLRAREAAEAASRAKDVFLANVSHEIRTPMNAVLGMTELALDSSPSEHQRQLLSTAHTAAKNLLSIINDLLDFSKMEAGKLVLERADFSLRNTVGETLRALAVRAHRKGLELRCNVRPDVPDALSGDAGRLRQVLVNLVGNAIKFTARGEVMLGIDAESSSDGAPVAVIFTVRDTGIGIARDKQGAIFRAFEQEDSSTTRKFGGTGLGLTIAAQLAGLMEGAITVQSAPGSGSTFRFTARFARSAMNLDLAPPSPAAQPGSRRELGEALRVVVAEDNELNVALLQELLTRRGHQAQFARDGQAALELAAQGTFDLMLLDLHMPVLDGFDVVRAIRDREKGTRQHLRIIALTARSSARDRERCLAAGMDEFLAKPIEAAALWAAMDRLVARWPLSGPEPRSVDPGLLDREAILRACDGDGAVLEKLRVAFRRSLPEQMARVRAALSDGDLLRLREAAHHLLGTVSTFSTATASVASGLEDAAEREDSESCTRLVERLGTLCDALLDATTTLSIDSLPL